MWGEKSIRDLIDENSKLMSENINLYSELQRANELLEACRKERDTLKKIVQENGYDMTLLSKEQVKNGVPIARKMDITPEQVHDYYVKYQGNVSMVAKKLGVSRNTVYSRLKEYENCMETLGYGSTSSLKK